MVVGSWYSPRVGKCLLLGTKFHRSALKIITSQVRVDFDNFALLKATHFVEGFLRPSGS